MSSSVSKDYLSKYYVGIESIPEDLTKIVDNILFIYELIRRSRVLGTKIPRELISSLRYWVSELVLRLRLNSYLSFEDIGRSIRKYMFRGDVHELELRKFLQLIINLWLKKITGKYDCLDVKDLVNISALFIGARVLPNNIFGKIVRSCDADLALRLSLNSLILSVGGVCYDDVLKD